MAPQDSGQGSWRLRLVLNAPRVNPRAVQWAIFSEDPRARFAADFRRIRQLPHTKDAEYTDTMGQTASNLEATVWDRLFKSVTGDRVYLLTPPPGEHFVKADDFVGPKWLATKAVRTDSGAYGWCVAVETALGRQSEVVLNDANVLNLAEFNG